MKKKILTRAGEIVATAIMVALVILNVILWSAVAGH